MVILFYCPYKAVQSHLCFVNAATVWYCMNLHQNNTQLCKCETPVFVQEVTHCSQS